MREALAILAEVIHTHTHTQGSHSHAHSQVREALAILAEVYRRARELWPLRPTTTNDHSVTIRIDQLKELNST